MPSESLTITDNRTGKTYELPITDETIKATDLRQIRTTPEDFGLMPYDPAYMNTACCRSRITYIDGDKGILEYRGYPIDQLAEKASFLETAYLLFHGELPTAEQLAEWTKNIAAHTGVPEQVKRVISAFDRNAHPMGMFMAAVAALGTCYPEAKRVADPKVRMEQIYRLLAKSPGIAAYIYRHLNGLPFVSPDPALSYSGNFLRKLFHQGDGAYTPNPILERALDVLFILHADHEQNCSGNAMRSVGSSHVDPFSAVAAAIAALYGPLHGGANEAVLRMLKEIGSVDKVAAHIKKVKAGEVRLMGFGHRVYKNYDPRAKVIKQLAEEVFEVTGKNPLLEVALELERIALQDEYFVARKLYPNIDFYTGLIYEAMKFPMDMFPVLFAIPRTAGWVAQWEEMLLDHEQKIARPRQIYLGQSRRDYYPMANRPSQAPGRGRD